MTEDIHKLELKLKRTMEENEYVKEHTAMLEAQLNEMASTAEEYKKEVDAKEQLIEFLNGKIEQLTEKNANEVAKLKEKLQAAQNENETVKAQTMKYSQDVTKAHQDTVKYYTTALEQQQAAHAAELERLRGNSGGADPSQATTHLQQEIESLKEQLEQASKQQELQRNIIESSNSNENGTALAQLREHTTALETFSKQLQDQNGQLREMISSQHAESAKVIEDLQAQKETLQSDLQTQIKAVQTLQTELRFSKDEVSRSLKQVEELQQQAATASASAAAAAVAAAEEELKNSGMEQQLALQGREAFEKEKEHLESRVAQQSQRLSELEAKIKVLEDEKMTLTTQLEVSSARFTADITKLTSEHEAAMRTSAASLQVVQQENELLKKSSAGATQEVEDKIRQLTTQQTYSDQEKESLRNTIASLKVEAESFRHLSEAVLSQLLPIVELPAGVGGEANRRQIDANATIRAAVQFIVKQRDQLTELKQSLGQWSSTYDQARQVNEALNAQYKQVWEQHAAAKEELALSQMAVANLEAEALRLKNSEATLMNDLKTAQSNAQHFEALLTNEKGSSSGQAEMLASLKNEIDQCRMLMAEKDDEVVEVRREHESLVKVLEQFQSSKARDVEEATQYLVFEIDQLKTEIRALHTQREEIQDRAEATARDLKKELGVKNVAITALQHKLNDLRRALEESISKLNDDHSIDKRVVSHLLVNYIHSVLSRRGDEEDIVKVMSGLLNWDSDMMQRAGLIPGPQNPHTKYAPNHHPGEGGIHSSSKVIAASAVAKGFFGGVVKSLWGDPASRVARLQEADKAAHGQSSGSNAAASETAPPKTIAEMWVDFLLTKSNEGEGAGPSVSQPAEEPQQLTYTPQSVAAAYDQKGGDVGGMGGMMAQPQSYGPTDYTGSYTMPSTGYGNAGNNNYGAYYLPQQQHSQAEQLPIGSSPYGGHYPAGQ